jgi:hypothetical protein
MCRIPCYVQDPVFVGARIFADQLVELHADEEDNRGRVHVDHQHDEHGQLADGGLEVRDRLDVQRKPSVVTIHVTITSTAPVLAHFFGRRSAGPNRTSSPVTSESSPIAPSQRAMTAGTPAAPLGVGTAAISSAAPTTALTTHTASPSESSQRCQTGRLSSVS